MLPLYNEFQLQCAEANPGLLFDKFANGWDPEWDKKLAHDVKKIFFSEFAEADYRYLQVNLRSYLERQEKLVCQLCGTDTSPLLYLKTDWRFVSGLGSEHPYETGFIWHRTLGVPYLPGSSIKGLMRAWVEQWCDMDKETRKVIQRLFGSGAVEGEGVKDEAGTLIIFDALPVRVPKLELDILNPHYQPYYENSNNPPADYYSPVPIFFLTVAPYQSFCFCLAPRPGAITEDTAGDVVHGYELLESALKTIGAGGKTAVGYGVFTDDPQELAKVEQRQVKSHEKELPKEVSWRRELARLQPKNLITRLSKNWAKTEKRYGNNLDKYLEIIREIHGEKIKTWQNSTNKNEEKAYKKIFPKDAPANRGGAE